MHRYLPCFFLIKLYREFHSTILSLLLFYELYLIFTRAFIKLLFSTLEKYKYLKKKPITGFLLITESARRESNPRPSPWQGDTRIFSPLLYRLSYLGKKRVMGIEPTYSAWKADILPLNYTRTLVLCLIFEARTI